ncbi:MAG: hypothetical protein HFJ33_02445 [Clostridia bacterium]|nr:hypothetical protein [Clostridia bacterium]
MKHKIIAILFIILFILCIPKDSIGYTQYPEYPEGDPSYEEYLKELEKKRGYSLDFCNGAKKIERIYITMIKNPDKWLYSPVPTMTNGWSYGWKLTVCNKEIDAVGTSMAWAKGAGCCGHNGEGAAEEPTTHKIKLFDVIGDEFINDDDSDEVKEEKRRKAALAFACLYRWRNNEYVPKHDFKEGEDVNEWVMNYVNTHPMPARTVIQNWLNTEPGLPSKQIPFFTDVENYDGDYGSLTLDGKSYSAKSYIASRSNMLKCNEEKMNQDKRNGIEPTVKWKTINGKNCTVIGPYRIDIKR